MIKTEKEILKEAQFYINIKQFCDPIYTMQIFVHLNKNELHTLNIDKDDNIIINKSYIKLLGQNKKKYHKSIISCFYKKIIEDNKYPERYIFGELNNKPQDKFQISFENFENTNDDLYNLTDSMIIEGLSRHHLHLAREQNLLIEFLDIIKFYYDLKISQ